MINSRIGKVDLKWSYVGDFTIFKGDLEDTSKVFGEAFIQEVRSRISDHIGSWATKPNIGSNIDEFEGLPNTKETGERLKADLSYALTKDGFLSKSDFSLSAVPVSETQILVRLTFLGILTDEPLDSKIIANIIFDLTGKGPHLVY